jgi:phage shock protein C
MARRRGARQSWGMSEPPFTQDPVHPAATPPARRLRRSRDERMIAGVCGGAAEYLGIDVTLLRIVFAVLVVFGGSGLVLYVIGWLVIPEEGTDEAVAHRWSNR